MFQTTNQLWFHGYFLSYHLVTCGDFPSPSSGRPRLLHFVSAIVPRASGLDHETNFRTKTMGNRKIYIYIYTLGKHMKKRDKTMVF